MNSTFSPQDNCLLLLIGAIFLFYFFPSTANASQHPYLSSHGIVFSTGNKHLSTVDFALSSVQSIRVKRYYNSQSTNIGAFGYGWSLGIAHFSHLNIFTDKIDLIEGSGRRIRFVPQGTDTWASGTGKTRSITLTDGMYQLADYDGRTREYDSTGRMTEEYDRNNNSILFSYVGDHLAEITDVFGQQLIFTYTNNLISTLSTPTGDFWYSYDANNNLISVQKPDGTIRQYLYDDLLDIHNLTGIVDEEGTHIQTLVYDDQDRVSSSTLADGDGQVSIEYLPSYVRNITNSDGGVTTYQLAVENGVARVLSSSGPDCSSCASNENVAYTYNSRQQVEQKTDANGNVTTYAYDSEGRRTSKTEALGTPEERTVDWTYDPVTDRTASISRASVSNPGQLSVTSNSYDANGNLTSRTESGYDDTTPISRTTTYTYDSQGRTLSVDGPRTDVADITTYTYYPDTPDLYTVTNALDHTTTYSQYNGFGRPELITTPNGEIDFTYDLAGRVLSRTQYGVTTTNTYDPRGLVTRIELPDSRFVTYTYTANGLVSTVADSGGNMLSYSYDSEGRRINEEISGSDDVLRKSLSFDYDERGRLTSVIRPDGSIDSTSYDNTDNIVTTTNALDLTTSYSHDALNRITNITAPGDTITTYGYNGNDSPVSVTDANGHETTYTFDDLGGKTSTVSPDSGTTLYRHDNAGNVISSTDATGITTTYEYDALNRLTAKHYPNYADDILYFYDQETNGIGRLTGITSSSIIYSRGYDERGNIIIEETTISGHTYPTSYTYNQSGQVLSTTYPSGSTVYSTYDNTGHVTRISTSFNGLDTEIADNIRYIPFGPVEHLEQGNGIYYDAVFDQQYQMTNQTAGNILDKSYTLNSLGNIVEITDLLGPDGNSSFSYDDQGRVSSETGQYSTINYSYDKVGNRLSMIDPESTTTYGYADGSNRLDRVSNSNRSYDLAGRTTSSENGKYRYSYNDSGRLETHAEKTGSMFFVLPVKDANGQVKGGSVITLAKFSKTQYLYDGFGRRVESLVTTDTSGRYHYHYDQGDRLIGFTVYDPNDTLVHSKEFIWLGNTPIAQADTAYNQDGTVESSSIVWLQTDHLNTPLIATDFFGNVVWKWDRTAFGTTEPDTDPDGDGNNIDIPLRFPGQVQMQGDGSLYYNWHRYYDPEIGRYISADPIGLAGGINLYAYARGNPVNAVDPLGLYWFRQDWQDPSIGREGTFIEPGGPVSSFLEDYMPAGHTFGELHDDLVGWTTSQGVPDWLANIPSMSLALQLARYIELLRSLGLLEQPTPLLQPCSGGGSGGAGSGW